MGEFGRHVERGNAVSGQPCGERLVLGPSSAVLGPCGHRSASRLPATPVIRVRRPQARWAIKGACGLGAPLTLGRPVGPGRRVCQN